MKKLTQPLKWFGGKGAFNGKLAKWIISLMPPRDTWNLFSESHWGAGAVSLAMEPVGISEIHNDINGRLMNFWDVLNHPELFARFQRSIESTSFSEAAFHEADRMGSGDMVEDAVMFFVRCRQSRAGQMKSYATPTARTRRGMNENVSAWLTAVEGLPAVHARVKRMEFCCMDGTEFIRKYDHPQRLYYCDPTYLSETRTAKDVYEHEMTRNQHAELLGLLADIHGKFILSGYRSDLYDTLSDRFGWHRRDFRIANNASGAKKKPKMTECVWTNYERVSDDI